MNNQDEEFLIKNLENLTSIELFQVAELHQYCLPYTIGSKLGGTHLVDFYQILIKDRHAVNRVAINNGQIVGLICSTTNFTSTQRTRMRYTKGILREVIKPFFLIQNFFSLVDLLLIQFKQRKIANKEGYIFLFFVSPEFRKKRIGFRLLSETLVIHQARNSSGIYVDTRKASEVAILLYKKFGFVESGRTYKSVILQKLFL